MAVLGDLDRSGMNRMRNIIIFASILVVLLLLLPLDYHAVWDGRFDLEIVVDSGKPIDESSLLFATCWNEREAAHAIQNLSLIHI